MKLLDEQTRDRKLAQELEDEIAKIKRELIKDWIAIVSNGLAFLFLAAFIVALLTGNGMTRNYVDKDTGCEYVVTWFGFAIAPRLGTDGFPLCGTPFDYSIGLPGVDRTAMIIHSLTDLRRLDESGAFDRLDFNVADLERSLMSELESIQESADPERSPMLEIESSKSTERTE